MALKAILTLDEFDELDENLRGLYKENQKKDGYILELDGAPEHPTVKGAFTTLERFREVAPDARAMAKIKTDFEALKEAWGDLDPEVVTADLARLAELDAGQGGEDIQARIDAAIQATERRMQRDIDKLTTERDNERASREEIQAKYEDGLIEAELDSGLKHIEAIEELRPGAKALIYRQYSPKVQRNELADGKVEFKPVIVTDAGEATISDFFETWATTDEALAYLPSSGNQGSQSRTLDGPGGRRRVNPWAKDTFNLTEQGKIVSENPALADQLAIAAGKTPPSKQAR